MNRSEFLEQYNNLLKFLRNINRLLELNDRFLGILKELPDPTQENTFYLDSDNELSEERYIFYYAIRRRLYRKTENFFEIFNEQLQKNRYKGLLKIINNMLDTLLPIINTRNIGQIYALKNELISASEVWLQGMEEAKDEITRNQREMVIKQSGVEKKNPETDSQTVSDLRNTAAARIKESAMRTVSKELSVQEVIDQRLREITEKFNSFRQLDLALQNLTDVNFMKQIATNLDNVLNKVPWVKAIVTGNISLKGLSLNDYRLAKFTLQNLFLKRKIKKSGVFEDDLNKINEYWRKRIRKRYGDNVPFCDEELNENNEWVPRDSLLASNLINNARYKLINKTLNNKFDDH